MRRILIRSMRRPPASDIDVDIVPFAGMLPAATQPSADVRELRQITSKRLMNRYCSLCGRVPFGILLVGQVGITGLPLLANSLAGD